MIYAVDVGSTIPRKGVTAFAWCCVDDSGAPKGQGNCPAELVSRVPADIRQGQSVSLGIEAPQFIPVPKDKGKLSTGRSNERDRSWAAPAGGYVAALALHQTAWLLRELRSECDTQCTLTVDPNQWYSRATQGPVIFCWEAFVSGPAHGTHAADAMTAAMCFVEHQTNLSSAVTAECPLSLFGTAVLWSGWDDNLAWLSSQLVVLRPEKPWVPLR